MTYLLLTRLKEFWPNEAPAVLMGPWCEPVLSDDMKESKFDIHQGKMLPCPWSGSRVWEAYDSSQEIYLSFLHRLSYALNKIHRTSYSYRYWQILVGPWLSWFIHVIYDKFSRLQLAVELYPNLRVIGLDPHSFVTPINTLDFVERIHHDDLYNLQIITRVAQNIAINIQLRTAESALIRKANQPASEVTGWLRPIIHRFHKKLQKKVAPKAGIVLCSSYHSRLSIFQLFILSWGKIVDHSTICPTPYLSLEPLTCDNNKRDVIKNLLLDSGSSRIPIKQDLLYSTIVETLAKELPMVFLEGYKQLETIATTEFGDYSPQAICSATAWYFNEPFKCWSAKSISYGVKLYGIQHGGTYGILSPLLPEEHELGILDGYLTWGWSDRQPRKPLIPVPVQKLMGIKHQNSVRKRKREGILFSETSPSRHLIYFPNIPELFPYYLSRQKRFFEKLNKTTLPLVRVRLHPEDNIWEIGKRLQKMFPTLSFDGRERSFHESLFDCRLYVCDHLSTTYAEALASNIPTILFWDSTITQIRPQAAPFFEDFRRVGILHETPESAAAWVEKVYPDVSSWWNTQECQKAVRNFCYNYARTSHAPLREWLSVLGSIAD